MFHSRVATYSRKVTPALERAREKRQARQQFLHAETDQQQQQCEARFAAVAFVGDERKSVQETSARSFHGVGQYTHCTIHGTAGRHAAFAAVQGQRIDLVGVGEGPTVMRIDIIPYFVFSFKWNWLLATPLATSIFFMLEKLGAVVGTSNLHIYAAMRGGRALAAAALKTCDQSSARSFGCANSARFSLDNG
ncbi:hypothetical protein [Paraburkholderia sp. BR10882]|uniref:hypothetical protein n=1 Tax=unclassified Paraburkholderia TaxID=2615204 RepID=UPI0034CFCB2D